MSDVTVTVTGLAGVITYEMVVIRRALEAAGVKVIVVDDHPADDEEAWVVEMKRRIDNDDWAAPYDWSKKVARSVTLVAKHCPCGG
jgi:nucleoside-diphosphate-sugar epimerase